MHEWREISSSLSNKRHGTVTNKLGRNEVQGRHRQPMSTSHGQLWIRTASPLLPLGCMCMYLCTLIHTCVYMCICIYLYMHENICIVIFLQEYVIGQVLSESRCWDSVVCETFIGEPHLWMAERSLSGRGRSKTAMQTCITLGRSLERVLPLRVEMAGETCLSLIPPGIDMGAAQEAWSRGKHPLYSTVRLGASGSWQQLCTP